MNMKLYCAMIFLTRLGISNTGADCDISSSSSSLHLSFAIASTSAVVVVFDSTLSKFKSWSLVSSAENIPKTFHSDLTSM